MSERPFRFETFDAPDGQPGIRVVAVTKAECDELVAENEALRRVAEAAGGVEWGPAINLIDGCSLPMDMQPWRERLLRQLMKLRAALDALHREEGQ